MKKIAIVLGLYLTFTSCNDKAKALDKTIEGNDVLIEFMFEKDSVKVYRFWDFGNYHYFTTLGETISTKRSNKTSREENIK